MAFDFINYIGDYRLYAAKATGDEYVLTCVICNKEKHLYYNIVKNKWICHSCGERGDYVRFIMVHQNIDYQMAMELILGLSSISMSMIRRRIKSFFNDTEHIEHKMIIPPPIYAEKVTSQKYPIFFAKRGYDKEIVLRLSPMVCEKYPYEGRIIFPFDCDGNKSFVAYASNEFIKPKTLNPIGSNNGDLIYGYHFWKSAKKIILVEGITDLIRLLHFGHPVMSLLGKEISDNRIYLIEKLKDVEEIIFLFDGDVDESHIIKKAEIINSNTSKKVTIAFIKNEGQDPDLLSYKEFANIYLNRETISKFKRRNLLKSL